MYTLKSVFSIFKQKKLLIIEAATIVLVLCLLYIVDKGNFRPSSFYFDSEDIYYEYQAAKELYHKANPYQRILQSNMIENDKYATLLPLYYYFLVFVRVFSHNEFDNFISNMRWVLFAFQSLGGLLLYLMYRRENKKLLGFAVAAIYLFNSWTLETFLLLKQDLVSIALLLASLYFLGKKSRLSYFLYGLSLGIKHIGVFALPLFLIPLIYKERTLREFIGDLIALGVPIILPAVPFLLADAPSFLRSMLFSFTRDSSGSIVRFGYERLLVNYSDSGLNGEPAELFLPRIPLAVATLVNFLLLVTKRMPKIYFVLTGILIFAVFNPVVFNQYIAWLPPLIFAAFAMRES